MRLFDSHCHLQDKRIFPKHEIILKCASALGVSRILCCGTNEHDWDNVAWLASNYETVIPAFGVHPWYVNNLSESWYQNLEARLVEFPGASVGEIGLDFKVNDGVEGLQVDIFLKQLELAERLCRPVSIHCRKAVGKLVEIIDRKGSLCRGVIHSYSGSAELVKKFEKAGLYISFSGSVTFDKNKRASLAAQAVSDERLLIETDSPDILPDKLNGLNEPANIVSVVDRIAFLRNTDLEQIAQKTYDNASRLFEFYRD